ncbi:MAG: ABC transporter ATP-binding protein [Terriglobia bacterium]
MKNLGRLLAYARPHRAWLVLGAVLMASVGVLEGAVVLLIRSVVQFVLEPTAAAANIVLVELPYLSEPVYLRDWIPVGVESAALLVGVALVGVFCLKAASAFTGAYVVQRSGLKAVTALRDDLYGHLLRQSLGFFQREATGRLISNAINDIDRIQHVVSHWLADFFRQSFTFLVLLVVCLMINWKLTLACVVAVPFLILPIARLGRRIRRLSRTSQEQLGGLSQILQETFSGVRIVQGFGMEQFEVGKFRQAARRLLETNVRWMRTSILVSPVMEILGALVIAVLLWYARAQVAAGAMTREMFFPFVVALVRLYEPVKRLTGIYTLFQQALGASERVFELQDRREEVPERPGAPALPPVRDRIEFQGVHFTYEGQAALLKGINLTARAGAVVAIVGTSGAGKSTLVNLLPRFFDITGGRILVDGVDIREVTLASLRAQIGIVTQETILFNDTVWNNICYGQRQVPRARVLVAARAALAHEFIERLPQGYETMIGERGVRLSGGQRQRLAIARALLKDAPILILDEATSELDTESEQLVQHALDNLLQGRTTFVIAHRLSTIRRADSIVVLEDGTIREVGTHQELLRRGGLYRRFYETQVVDLEAQEALRVRERV